MLIGQRKKRVVFFFFFWIASHQRILSANSDNWFWEAKIDMKATGCYNPAGTEIDLTAAFCFSTFIWLRSQLADPMPL